MIYKKKTNKNKNLMLFFAMLFAFLTFTSYAIYFLAKWEKTNKPININNDDKRKQFFKK